MDKKYLLASLSISIAFVLSLLFIIGVVTIDFINSFKSLLLILAIIFLNGVILYAYFSKDIKIYNKGVFVGLLINILLFYSVLELNETYDYLRNLICSDSTYVTYHVYVQKRTTRYSNLDKLSGKKIGMLESNDVNVKNYLERMVSIECYSYENVYDLVDALLNGEVQSFILNEEEYNAIDENSTNIKEKIRVISTDKIKETI